MHHSSPNLLSASSRGIVFPSRCCLMASSANTSKGFPLMMRRPPFPSSSTYTTSPVWTCILSLIDLGNVIFPLASTFTAIGFLAFTVHHLIFSICDFSPVYNRRSASNKFSNALQIIGDKILILMS